MKVLRDICLNPDGIEAWVNQSRQTFDPDALRRLAEDIKNRGMFNPLLVRYDAARGKHVLIAGERRFRALLLNGATEIPCRVVEGELSEADVLEANLVENMLREDLNPMEQARGFERLMQLRGCTGKEAAARLNVSGAKVSRDLTMLLLPQPLQQAVAERKLEPSIAYEIARLPDHASMLEVAQPVLERRVTRADVIREVQARIGKKNVTPRGNRIQIEIEGGYRLSLSNGETLTREAVVAALTAALKRAKKATGIEELKGAQA